MCHCVTGVYGERSFHIIDVVNAVHAANEEEEEEEERGTTVSRNNLVKRSGRGEKVTIVDETGSPWLKSFSGTTADLSNRRDHLFKRRNNGSVIVWGRLVIGGDDENKDRDAEVEDEINSLIKRVTDTTPTDTMVLMLFQRGLGKVRGMMQRRRVATRPGGNRGTRTWNSDDERKLKEAVEMCRIGRGLITMGKDEVM